MAWSRALTGDGLLVTNLQMPLIVALLVWWSRDAYSALKRSECSCWF